MNNIYKSDIICEHCNKPILWYALINKIAGVPIVYGQSDVEPHREAKVLRSEDKTAMLKIRCKECDKINTFSHTLEGPYC